MRPLAAALDGVLCRGESKAGVTAPLVFLIPTGRLALLPLHAANYEKGGKEHAFLDEYAVAYVPSARVLSACREALMSLSNGPPTLVAVGNPLPLNHAAQPLAFARAEAEEVSKFFEDRAELFCEDKADRTGVQHAIRSGTYLHFACHGKFELANPLSSGVILANGERLALVDLYTGPAFGAGRARV
jgi:CHAT domain-containing protein